MSSDNNRYNQEIDELTALLRDEWDDLKSCVIEFGIDPKTTYLVAFTENNEEQ